MTAVLTTLNLAVERRGSWATLGHSGIDKRPVAHRVMARHEGLEGDLVADRRVHGGPDKAVYAFAREDAVFWERELGREIRPGNFGENLSTTGLDITGAEVGERWAIGEAVFEVIRARKPCRVFAGFWDVPDLVKRFIAQGAPGAYLRVLKEGTIGAGDPIEIIERPGHGVTIGYMLRALTTEPHLMPRFLDAPQMLPKHHEKARKWLATHPQETSAR